MKKLTKRDYFNTLLTFAEVQENQTLVDFINHELELLAKKNSAEKKPTAQQTANAEIGKAIANALAEEPERLFTVTEIIKTVPACAELTKQRVSAILRGMIGDTVDRIVDKRKTYFRYLA